MQNDKELLLTIFNAIEQSSDAVFITDREGTIVYANPSFEKVTGFGRKEAVGKNSRILKSGCHPVQFYKDMWDTILSGTTWSRRIINKRKDGISHIEETHISPILNCSGEITHFISIRKDITKEIELENQVFEAQKMDSLALLSGQLAHDFNNLLTMVIGSMDVIIEDLKKNSASRRLAEAAIKMARDYANLTKQLLIFARKQETARQAKNLNSLIEETKPLFKTLLGEKIEIEFDLAKNLSDVYISPEQFKQVIFNILANARDAMSGTGKITIKTLQPLDKQKYVSFEIKDTGKGMDKNTLSRIFEPFFTTKPKGKGTGLGLSTVYGIVKQHGGEIWVESEPGKGTTFTIRMPAAS